MIPDTHSPAAPFDLGHRGDFDYTLIDKLLAIPPAERLRRHERWRGLFRKGRGVQNFVEDMVVRLQEGGVEFLIVGGVSAVLQGAAVTTMDLDLCYRRTPENIRRLVHALSPLRPRPQGFPAELPFAFDEWTVSLGSNFTLDVGSESLDLLGEKSGLGGYEAVVGQAVDVPLGGRVVKVLSLGQLIATKEAAGRAKDLAVLPELRATLARRREHEKPGP